ncbi:MAG: hypothetical protein IT584_01785 [Chlamydiae bacterium]|nr:hypothetical protein [Chlamydiota bacterium]
MWMFKLLFPLIAHMDLVQPIEEILDQDDQVVVLEDIFEDPSQIYDIEFDGDDDLISFDDLETSCLD